MFKRVLLSLTFVAALTAASFVPARPAEAWRSWGRPYAARYYYGPRPYYYGGYAPYQSYYRSYYAPPVYDPYYYNPYPYGSYYYGRPGVAVSFGF